jgi:hypothetical protein
MTAGAGITHPVSSFGAAAATAVCPAPDAKSALAPCANPFNTTGAPAKQTATIAQINPMLRRAAEAPPLPALTKSYPPHRSTAPGAKFALRYLIEPSQLSISSSNPFTFSIRKFMNDLGCRMIPHK